MSGRGTTLALFLFLIVVPGVAASGGPCEEFLAEADAFSGPVPKFHPDGSLRSLSLYADATFLVPKRSLSTKARRKAELRAKRAFAEWMEISAERGYTLLVLDGVEHLNNSGNAHEMTWLPVAGWLNG